MIHLTDLTYNSFITKNYSIPILIMFTSTRCAPCKKMYPLIESLEKENYNLLIAKVDTDNNLDLVQNLGIRSIPTLLLIHNANIIKRSGFLASKQEILNFIKV